MDAKDFSKWIWDVAKYVLTAILITSFLGGFQDNKLVLYLVGVAIFAGLAATGIYFHRISKKQQS